MWNNIIYVKLSLRHANSPIQPWLILVSVTLKCSYDQTVNIYFFIITSNWSFTTNGKEFAIWFSLCLPNDWFLITIVLDKHLRVEMSETKNRFKIISLSFLKEEITNSYVNISPKKCRIVPYE